MKALTYDPKAKRGITLGETGDPKPTASQALVEVHSISLMLAKAFALVAAGGIAESVGMASLEPTTIDFEAERGRGGGRKLEVFTIGDELGADLAHLLSLVAARKLDAQIGHRSSWEKASEAADQLFDRKIAGKIVLEVCAENV